MALPENFRIHDLEKFNLNRFRFRGALSTASIDDFTRYSKDLADEGTRCFIDADNMRAVSVLMKAPAALSMPIICVPSVCLTWVLLMSLVTQITPPLSN